MALPQPHPSGNKRTGEYQQSACRDPPGVAPAVADRSRNAAGPCLFARCAHRPAPDGSERLRDPASLPMPSNIPGSLQHTGSDLSKDCLTANELRQVSDQAKLPSAAGIQSDVGPDLDLLFSSP